MNANHRRQKTEKHLDRLQKELTAQCLAYYRYKAAGNIFQAEWIKPSIKELDQRLKATAECLPYPHLILSYRHLSIAD